MIALPFRHSGIDTHAVGELQRQQRPGRRQKTARGILGVDARLDGMALQRHAILLERQALTRCNPELPFDQIKPGDRLGHRVLDLQPRVHLHEPVAVGPQSVRAVGDELHRPRADIADRKRCLHRSLAHRRAQCRAHAGGRRLLDHLLMAALQRTVALVEVDRIAVRIGEHLQFDVAWRRDIFLDQHPRVAERTFGFALGGLKRQVEIGVLVDTPHTLAAAAGDRLDQHRITDLVGLLFEKRRLLALAVITGHDRHAGLLHQGLGAVLQAHGADCGRRRPDEHDAGLGASLGEFGVLGKKAVARMDALRAGLARHFERCGR